MRIETKVFKDFVSKASINGIIECIVIRQEGDTIITRSRDITTAGYAQVSMKATLGMNEVAIMNTSRLLEVLGIFGKEITVQVQCNLFVVTDGEKTSEFVVGSTDTVIETDFTEKPAMKREFDAGFTVKAEQLAETTKFKKILDEKKLYLTVDGDTLSLTVGSKGFDKLSSKVTITPSYRKVQGTYAPLLDSMIEECSGTITLSFLEGMDDAGPLRIKQQTDKLTYEYIIAPLIEDDSAEDDAGGEA